eukprot:2829864-Alexandrium_andersonii.AAC.1
MGEQQVTTPHYPRDRGSQRTTTRRAQSTAQLEAGTQQLRLGAGGKPPHPSKARRSQSHASRPNAAPHVGSHRCE